MDLMAALHPALSGEFDLHTLLQHPPPKTWRPKEKGERLSGFVWKVTQESNRSNYTYPVLHVIDINQVLWKLSCAPVTLRKQVEKNNITKHCVIECEFKGTGEPDEGRTYRKFKLEKI